MAACSTSSNLSLTGIEREQIRALVVATGDVGSARSLGVSRQTLARAIAGLGLRRGTVALLRVQLAGGILREGPR
jgi:hypothetical protein